MRILAQGYLQAKASAYQQAQVRAGHVVRLHNPWQMSESDVKSAQKWAEKQVESIISTYEKLLRNMLEDLPEERALGDIIGKLKQIGDAIGDWIKGFLGWKPGQIADQTWNTGLGDGVGQWVEDAKSDDIDGDTSRVRRKVVPETSSSDFCAEYAGKTFALDEEMPYFPAHINCIHSIEIIVDDMPSRNLVIRSQEEVTYLFMDLDGVLSIPNAGNPAKVIDSKEGWPIPQASALLQAIDREKRLHPVWLTHWGNKANAWNDEAGIEHWPVRFPLSEKEEKQANQVYPDLNRKVLAIQYCMYQEGVKSAVWMQDGFAPEEEEWARSAHVRLLDTNKEPLHSLLLEDRAQAIQSIIASLDEVAYVVV